MNKMKRSLVLFAMALSFVFLAGSLDVKAAALKLTSFKQTQASNTGITFEAASDTDADYYGAILYKDAKCTSEATKDYSRSLNFSFSGLTIGSRYFVKIGYGTSSSNCYANLSEDIYEVVTTPGEVSNVKFVDATEKTVKLTWNKAQGADLYLVETKDGEFYSDKESIDLTVKSATYAYILPVKCLSNGTPKAAGRSTYISGFATLSSSIPKDSFGLTGMTSNSVTIAVGSSLAPVYGQKWEAEGKPIKGSGKKISLKDTSLYSKATAKVTNNTMYQFRVRTYVVLSDGTKKYSKWSDYKYFLNSKGGKTVSGDYGKITVKWKKLKNVSRVVIKMATSKDGKYKKVATAKPGAKKAVITKFGKSGLQSGKTYYVRIEMQTKVKGKYKTSEIVGTGTAWCR